MINPSVIPMDDGQIKRINIHCSSEEEATIVYDKIYDILKDNDDYKAGNIRLTNDLLACVVYEVFKESKSDPMFNINITNNAIFRYRNYIHYDLFRYNIESLCKSNNNIKVSENSNNYILGIFANKDEPIEISVNSIF